jgi:hypothetical protein
MMKIETIFRVGRDPKEKLNNALVCADELSKVSCSWHSHCAVVKVLLDENGELKWNINDFCCDNLKKELAKAIEEVSPKL